MTRTADLPAVRCRNDWAWRIEALKLDVKDWVDRAKHDQQSMGLHSSQLQALQDMMSVLIQRELDARRAGLIDSASESGPQNFRDAVRALVNVWQVWEVFRVALMRRRGPERTSLEIADILAAQCFAESLDLADSFQRVRRVRPAPPLVHPMLCEFPAAIYRDLSLGFLGIRVLTSQRVPLPVAAVPSDHLSSIGLSCFLYHEVGHFIDRELGISLAIADEIARKLSAAPRREIWLPWVGELVADTFGVLFGGPAFAIALIDLMCGLGPAIPPQPEYPPYWLRSAVVAELVNQLAGKTWQEEVGQIAGMLPAPPPRNSQASLMGDVSTIVAACLEAPVPKAGSTQVGRLAPELAQKWTVVRRLGRYLAGQGPRPTPSELPCRLVPASAVMALTYGAADRAQIEKEARLFAAETERPHKPGGPMLESFVAAVPSDDYRQMAMEMKLA